MSDAAQNPGSQLIQIVPRFPPGLDGLGEFALKLGDALLQLNRTTSDFVVWRPGESATPGITGPHRIYPLTAPTASALEETVQPLLKQNPSITILLHYTSYSYSKEGLPLWLPDVLKRLKARGARVVTFFHELYATGRFPNKTWMGSWLQKRIFRQILQLSDAAITSNAGYYEEIKTYSSTKPLLLTGIGSNVGEPIASIPWDERKRRLVVFGLPATRERLYRQHLPNIKSLCSQLAIDELADLGSTEGIGSTIDDMRKQFSPIFRSYGVLPMKRISNILANSLAGAVNYRYDLRFKSGVVAAYQAHALPAILFTPKGEQVPLDFAPDALAAEEVFSAQDKNTEAQLGVYAKNGFNYYRSHRSFETIAKDILPLLHC
jgi:hypothetical protein